MSEYQFYEFLSVDKPLKAAEVKALQGISSRARISATHFCVHYNWGDLKTSSERLLERYFDVHVYVANWGTHHLGLRLPGTSITPGDIAPYCVEDGVMVRRVGPHVVVDLMSQREPEGWEEGEGWMGSLAPIRSILMNGDMRPLYLGWLAQIDTYEAEQLAGDDLEAPVPPGLQSLSAPLSALANFLCIDKHLLTAAAEASPRLELGLEGLPEWIASLEESAKDALLCQVLRGEHSVVSAELHRRFQAERSLEQHSDASPRTVGELLARRAALRQAEAQAQARLDTQERQRREEAAAAQKEKRLDDLSKKRDAAWQKVATHIDARNEASYDKALRILVDLRDLAARDGEGEAFAQRFDTFIKPHTRKVNLIKRLRANRPMGRI